MTIRASSIDSVRLITVLRFFLFFICLIVDLRIEELDAGEPICWNALEQHAIGDAKSADSQTVQVLHETKWHTAHVSISEHHCDDLHCENDKCANDQSPVAGGKDIVITFTNFSRVYLIEQLHEDEGLEDHRIHQHLVSGLLLDPATG